MTKPELQEIVERARAGEGRGLAAVDRANLLDFIAQLSELTVEKVNCRNDETYNVCPGCDVTLPLRSGGPAHDGDCLIDVASVAKKP